jgi:hypothetical protein
VPLTPADLPPELRRRVLEQAGATPTRARRTAAAPQVCVCRAEGCGVALSGETAAARHTREHPTHSRQEAVNE